MFVGAETGKKSLETQESDGFFYFNPNKGLDDDNSFEEELDITMLKENQRHQKRRFFFAYIVLTLINVLTMGYWLMKINEIIANEEKNRDCDSNNHCSSSSISFLIKTLIFTHSLWLMNFFFKGILQLWKFYFGISIYFSTLILVFFARTTVNIFVFIARKKLDLLLNGSFDIFGYFTIVLFQTFGDIFLLIFVIKMRRLNQRIENLEDEKLMEGSLLKVRVYNPQIEKTARVL